MRWVAAVHKGNPGQKVVNIPVEFVPGGSIVWVGKGRDKKAL